MAFAGDAIAEAEAATKRNRRRISDYLGDSDGDGGDVASPPSPETPPRLRLPRFTCARIRFGRLGRKRGGGGRKEVAAAEKSKDASVESPAIAGRRQAAGSSGNSGASAEAGMGLSMLLFLAKTRVELNRMAEVRAQMEALLKEMRDEASKMKSADHAAVDTPRTCSLQPSSSTTSASSSCTSDTNTNCHTTASSGTAIARGEVREKPSEDEGCARRDATDEELETEPAQRQILEFKWSTEEETSESSDDDFIELKGGHFTSGSLRRDAADDDDGSDEDEEPRTGEREGGVSAVELERRLHELRHRRDMERIKKLESALRRAERKLTEKEMEARLWQDTAALALRRPSPPPADGQ